MEQPPGEPSPEEIEREIESLLEKLEGCNQFYAGLDQDWQDKWYDAEMEAKVAKDRSAAKTHLEEFIHALEQHLGRG